jgi:glycosyltransferase involved in cell wall biosynthesis
VPAPESAATPTTTPDVTVVVPTRGRPDLVRLTVQAIVEQRYPGAIDCIVVHDQEPPEESLEEMARPGRSVRVFRNEGAPGLSGSRNFGLRLVVTDIVASCDDDDTWLPDKVARQVARLTETPSLWVVGAGIRLRMAENRVVTWLGPKDLVTQADLLRGRRKELHSSTLLMRRAVFDEVGGYDESLPHSYAEDYEWLLRASRLGPIGVVREPLADINKISQSWFRERNEVVSAALQHVLSRHPEIRRSRRGHARILGQVAFAEASLGNRREAMRWVGRSMRRWPFAPQVGLALVEVAFAVDPRTLLRTARLVGRGLS